jgi:predicted HicB family RNase H-like nuclease
MKSFMLTVDGALHSALKVEAARRGITMRALIRLAIEKILGGKNEHAEQAGVQEAS